jgi:hypothetical protein
MKYVSNIRQKPVYFAFASCLLGALVGSGCMDDGAGIPGAAGNESAGEGTGATAPQGGSASSSGAGNTDTGGEAHEGGGTGPAAGSGGTAGATPGAEGGTTGEEPQGGMPGVAGQPDDGVHIARPCMFHTPAPTPPTGEGGAGGEAAAPNVMMQPNAFVGAYLTDSAGRTLYTYGADLPGDCQTPPQSVCVADCLVS